MPVLFMADSPDWLKDALRPVQVNLITSGKPENARALRFVNASAQPFNHAPQALVGLAGTALD